MPIKKIKNKEAVKISGVYFLVSFLYILFSDKLLLLFTRDVEKISHLQTYKGWGFVLLSAVLIYYLVYKELQNKKHLLENLKKNNNSLNILNQELESSKEKYKTLFNNINDGAFLHKISEDGMPGLIIEVNDSACRQLKYKREELLKKTILDINASSANAIAEETIDKIRKEKKILFQVKLLDKNRKEINFEVSSHYFNLNNEEVIISLTRNIEERLKTENELKKAKEQLEESKNRYKTIAEASLDGIFIYSSINKVEYVNPAACKMHELSEEELLKMQPKEFIHPESYPVFLEFIKTIDNGKEFHGQATGITKDGDRFYVKVYGCPIYFGGLKKYFGIIRDITQQKLHESNIISAKEKAEEADKLKSAFLMNMSHEIRTPMNGIIGFSELLEKENLNDETKFKYINIIKSSGQQLLRIINDIIDISKIETNQYNIIKRQFSLNDLIDDIESLLKTTINNKPIIIIIKKGLDDKDSILFSDKERIFQILSNLTYNALKFTKQGEIEIGYSLTDNQNLEFYVRDTGIGIPDDKRSIIFERFRQADDTISRNYGGTGLGLPIAKGIVEKLGGRINVNSETGKGSTFIFTIPYTPAVK